MTKVITLAMNQKRNQFGQVAKKNMNKIEFKINNGAASFIFN